MILMAPISDMANAESLNFHKFRRKERKQREYYQQQTPNAGNNTNAQYNYQVHFTRQ